MSQITISVNGRDYVLGCADGEEDRLRGLAGELDQRVTALIGEVGQIGDARLMVMQSLLLLDQMKDAREDEYDAAGLETLAERIEALAVRLEQA